MRIRKKRGQVLVAVLGLVILFYCLALFVLETGRFVSAKIHLQNTADSVAMESGIWYARSLNLTSMVNKLRYVTAFIKNEIGDLVTYILNQAYDRILSKVCPGALKPLCKAAWKVFEKYAVPYVQDLVDYSVLAPDEAMDQTIAKLQVQFKRNIPLTFVYTNALRDLTVLKLRDGTYCFPCFSAILPSLDIFTDYERQNSVKVTYRYYDPVASKYVEVKQDEVGFDPKANKWRTYKSPHYYTDRIVKTDKDDPERNAMAEAKKSLQQIQDEAERQAAEDELKSTLLSQFTYIEETGKQQIYVLCAKKYKPAVLSKLWPDKWLVAVSKVRIEGGSMSVFDEGGPAGGGAQYYPKLENVGISEAFTTVETAMFFLDKTLGKYLGFSIENTALGNAVNVLAKVNH